MRSYCTIPLARLWSLSHSVSHRSSESNYKLVLQPVRNEQQATKGWGSLPRRLCRRGAELSNSDKHTNTLHYSFPFSVDPLLAKCLPQQWFPVPSDSTSTSISSSISNGKVVGLCLYPLSTSKSNQFLAAKWAKRDTRRECLRKHRHLKTVEWKEEMQRSNKPEMDHSSSIETRKCTCTTLSTEDRVRVKWNEQ